MILGDLIGLEVRDDDGRPAGRVIDVRFRLEGSSTPSEARMVGIIVSPRSASSFMGYERASLSRPVILDRFLTWIHRGSFLVNWEDIRRIDHEAVRLRAEYEKRSSTIDS